MKPYRVFDRTFLAAVLIGSAVACATYLAWPLDFRGGCISTTDHRNVCLVADK